MSPYTLNFLRILKLYFHKIHFAVIYHYVPLASASYPHQTQMNSYLH